MELTNEEKKILMGISFNPEGVEDGDLLDNDLVLLDQMRSVASYLKEKYPSYNFEITGCEPKSGTTRDYDEWFFKAKEVDRASAFIASIEGEAGKFQIRDDFFGEIVKASIEKEVSQILSDGGFDVVEVNVSFWEQLGKEYGEGISPDEVLKGEIAAENDIKVFIDGSKLTDSQYEKTVGDMEDCLKKEKVCGEVYVVILSSRDGDFAKDRLYSDSFAL